MNSKKVKKIRAFLRTHHKEARPTEYIRTRVHHKLYRGVGNFIPVEVCTIRLANTCTRYLYTRIKKAGGLPNE